MVGWKIINWDINNQQWSRIGLQRVALKSLNNSSDSISDILKEVESNIQLGDHPYIIQCFGISQDPQTLDYIMVMEFATSGSLRTYLNINFNNMKWQEKIMSLWNISKGLYYLHDKNLIHRDFHPGNLLFDKNFLNIADLGLCKSANQNSQSKKVYGVLPYVAPEVLYRNDYTMASDIYSFGIVAYEIITGLPPYYDIPHDNDLTLSICQGLRPKIPSHIPALVTKLMMQCWDAQPDKRPTSRQLFTIINKWHMNNFEFNKYDISSPSLSYKLHSKAIYTSRLLDTSNLSLPVNAPDYGIQLSNLNSKKISGIYLSFF